MRINLPTLCDFGLLILPLAFIIGPKLAILCTACILLWVLLVLSHPK